MQRARWSFLVLKFLGARVNASSALLYITVPPLNHELKEVVAGLQEAVDGEGRQKEAHANGDTTRNAENEEEELLRAAIDITDVGDQDDEA